MLRSKGVDGIIFTSAHMYDSNIAELAEEGFPIILVNRRTSEPAMRARVDYVGINNTRGGYVAVEHLIRLGHERIGVIAGQPDSSVGVERLEGGKKALEAYGLEETEAYFTDGDFLKGSGYEAGRRFMGMVDPPTAVFATNDYMALGAYEAILDQGFKIPEEVALVGFNDIEFSAIKGIELTTIGQKKSEMGPVAVRMLVDRVEGRRTETVQETILEPELVIRKTCGFHLRGYQRNGLESPLGQASDGLHHPVNMEGSR